MMDYKWNGEPVKVEFGYSMVKKNREKPLYWYNRFFTGDGKTEVCIPSVRVYYGDTTFVLANIKGIAHRKLELGGFPSVFSASLPDDGFEPDSAFFIEPNYDMPLTNSEFSKLSIG